MELVRETSRNDIVRLWANFCRLELSGFLGSFGLSRLFYGVIGEDTMVEGCSLVMGMEIVAGGHELMRLARRLDLSCMVWRLT